MTARATDPPWIDNARQMRAAGATYAEIAKTVGTSKATAARYLDPAARATARECSYRRYKETQHRCHNCGTPVGYRNVRCRKCTTRIIHQTWTPEDVIHAIRTWEEEHGEPPRKNDWDTGAARGIGHNLRAEQFESDRRWPYAATVIARFGSWNKAIRAAGFTPRMQGYPT